MEMNASLFAKFLEHAIEKEKKDHLMDAYLTLYPYMHLGMMEFKSFEDFVSQQGENKPVKCNKSPEEIEAEMLRVVEAYERRVRK